MKINEIIIKSTQNQFFAPIPTDQAEIDRYVQLAKSHTNMWQVETKKSFFDRFRSKEDVDALVGAGIALEAWKRIRRDCSYGLDEMISTHKVLNRGSKRGVQSFVDTSRIDRKPVDTKENEQKVLDEFLAIAGFDARRSNSIFATSDSIQAAFYGPLYFIFPVNGAQYTYNKKFKDFYSSGTLKDMSIEEFIGERGTTEDINTILDKWRNDPNGAEIKANQLGFYRNDLITPLKKGYEVYIHGKYYAIRKGLFDSDPYKKTVDAFNQIVKKVINPYED